ncbi:MAG: DUF91 domain-containing protein [Bacilli bacterium]|nr:DUF91 domain-containing protein [Bacilli bacterium]
MTTHVFIVDSRTFKIHLEYLFVGTGARENLIDFNNSETTQLHHKTEETLAGLMADASRIRRGDQILFYLQQDARYNGKFFGVFKAIRDWSFLDNFEESGRNQYLYNELGKSLTFRTLIEPFEVFAEGITEWEALDDINNTERPYQMAWSLIYRKLKGNRGNTMLTIYEAEKLIELIKFKNNQQYLDFNNRKLSFDINEQKIVSLDGNLNIYAGRNEDINVLPRLIAKYNAGQAFEPLLQAYILKAIGTNINSTLNNSIVPEGSIIEWIGNEVSCGVGMQSIDVMLSVFLASSNSRIVIPVELKATLASIENLRQIQRYVDWIKQYYITNLNSVICPILLAKENLNKESASYIEMINAFNVFNISNIDVCDPLIYIEYSVDNQNLFFEKVIY